ncbi:MAG: hypothetical protein GY909_01985 [Oligoflexia bacterium]|nr:hypothetical protein [Oligoflexia bacterium]
MENIITLKEKAKQEIYKYIDKNIRSLPKKDDGSFNEFAEGFYLKYSYKTVDGVEFPISKRDRFKFNNLG